MNRSTRIGFASLPVPFLTLIIALWLGACGQQTPIGSPPPVRSPTPSASVSPTSVPGMKTLPSGLQYQDLIVGTGQKSASRMKVRIDYVGKLQNGTVFDKGVNDFTLGTGAVIKGWDQGIAGGPGVEPMREGGKRKLIIPPSLGYGEKIVSTIPPNSTLIFDIELLRVSK